MNEDREIKVLREAVEETKVFCKMLQDECDELELLNNVYGGEE